MEIKKIGNLIFLIRGERVMLDAHLAELYEVTTSKLNQAVKRNQTRFPKDFMFQLNDDEWNSLRSQIVISKKGRGGRRYNPNVFTEQGVAMLSSVLKSERAINVNIAIMRTFVKMRILLDENLELKYKLEAMEERYDEQFDAVFEAIKKLIGKKKEKRNPIGYKRDQ